MIVTDDHIVANLMQMVADYFEGSGEFPPEDTVFVSWLPFYHDMGLFMGILAPLLTRRRAVVMSPIAFLQRPARWMQLLADNRLSFSASPNFGFELAVRRTTDDDMAGRDLGAILGILSGAERINPATINRFHERFAQFNIKNTVVWPSYGLAEATVYVASPPPGHPPATVRFDYEKLSAGHAQRCDTEAGSELVSYGAGTCLHGTNRRSRNPDGEPGRKGRGDLGARRQRLQRILAKSAGVRSGLSALSWPILPRARPLSRGCAPGIWG